MTDATPPTLHVSTHPAVLHKLAVLRDGCLEAFGPVASVLRPMARPAGPAERPSPAATASAAAALQATL